MFKNLFLAKCGNRSILAKRHPTSGAPEDWLSTQILEQHGLYGLTFDFFVNWNLELPTITPVIWIKKRLSARYNYAYIVERLSSIMVSELGETYLNRLYSFMSENKFTVQFIIFRDDFDWVLNESELLHISFAGKDCNGFLFTSKIVTISELRTLIQEHSGGPVQIGAKGLTFGTSNLECFLSGTGSLYPGDVDLILFNHQDHPIAILEYKKHTLTNSISNQKLANYYPNPDARKYDRLSILKDYLENSNRKIPLFNIYYPTNPTSTEGRLELLKGETGNLSTHIGSNFLLPTSDPAKAYHTIIIKLLKGINYHQSLK